MLRAIDVSLPEGSVVLCRVVSGDQGRSGREGLRREMALSQLQCLDNEHINYRVNVTKPEFFYSEAQRLAVEVLVAEGIHAFHQTVAKESLREFLSHLDIQQILSSVRDFHGEDPPPATREVEDQGGDDEVGQGDQESKPLSLHYWPESSDVSRPGLDLGWPDCAAYRGVTRANVYTQPPLDGSMHIKEMFRRMISQAQKVIAVAMDIFTDIDIFKDLLDASFRRKIPVYIIHDEANIEYFMKMCDDAQMHMGMLKVSGGDLVGGQANKPALILCLNHQLKIMTRWIVTA